MRSTISKSALKTNLLEILRKIEKTGKELVITDHGRPVLKIVPFLKTDSVEDFGELRNSVVKYEDPMEPVEESWEVLKK